MAIQAARLTASRRALDLTVSNLPARGTPASCFGRELHRAFPAVAPGRNRALSVALTSHAGRLCVGLLADADAFPDLDRLATALREAVAESSPSERRDAASAAERQREAPRDRR